MSDYGQAKVINPLEEITYKIFDEILKYSPREQNEVLVALKNRLIDNRKQMCEKVEISMKDLADSLDQLQKI